MPAEYKIRWHCKRCQGEVKMNYDHVGDCATGRCDGTFSHVVSLRDGRRCDLAFEDLTHANVGWSFR